MYSYGWREYMPDIGRWNGMDQLAENYLSASPYAYVMNNPINMMDPDGRVTMAALTQAMWDQTPDGTNSYWQNNHFGDSDSGGKPGGGGGSFVYVGGTAGLYAGYGIGSTLDMNGNFNSHYGTVTNGVLNYMYWTNGVPASGNSIEGLNAHKGSLNLNASNSTNTSWDPYKNWADYGSGTFETIYEAIADQRTSLYNRGYWIDNLGNQRSIRYAGRAVDSQIGLRSSYLRTTAMYGKYAERAGWVGYALGAYEVGEGLASDGWKPGKNTTVAAAKVGTGIIVSAGVSVGVSAGVGWLSAAMVGAGAGSIAPGVGTVVGFVAGAIVGYIASEYVGEQVEGIYK